MVERLHRMKNPWLKKNPLLSMWLSNANAVTGAARSRIAAETHRQATAMLTKGMKQAAEFWSGGMVSHNPPKRKKKRQ